MSRLSVLVRQNVALQKSVRPLYIRVCKGRETAYLQTPYSVAPDELDEKGGLLDKSRSEEILAPYERIMAQYELDDRGLSARDMAGFLRVAMRGHVSPESFTSYYERTWRPRNVGVIRGIKNYDTSISRFKAFLGRNTLLPEDICTHNLQRFADFLHDKPRAAVLYVNSLARVFREMKEDINDEDIGYVVIKHSIRKIKTAPQITPEKRALPADVIKAIFKLKRDESNPNSTYNLGLDCFKLSFALLGMNSMDMFKCARYENGRVIYNRSKTCGRRSDKALIEVEVPECVREVFSRYYDGARSKHVFNFHKRFKTPGNFNRSINLGLKEVGRKVGVDDLQFYCARHSMATIAANELRVPPYVINDMLCHVDAGLRVTNMYIKKDFKEINEANAKLLAYMGFQSPKD